jgi:hypothetical protein
MRRSATAAVVLATLTGCGSLSAAAKIERAFKKQNPGVKTINCSTAGKNQYDCSIAYRSGRHEQCRVIPFHGIIEGTYCVAR